MQQRADSAHEKQQRRFLLLSMMGCLFIGIGFGFMSAYLRVLAIIAFVVAIAFMVASALYRYRITVASR